jgi:hypothetical protein
LTFASIIRGNQLHDWAKVVLRYYDESPYRKRLSAVRDLRRKPWSLATRIEGNTVSDSPLGIDAEPGFEGVMLRNNHFVRVSRRLHRIHIKPSLIFPETALNVGKTIQFFVIHRFDGENVAWLRLVWMRVCR